MPFLLVVLLAFHVEPLKFVFSLPYPTSMAACAPPPLPPPAGNWQERDLDWAGPPEDEDESEDETMDPTKCLLDLRPRLKKYGGCGFKGYMRKTGCLNVRCVCLISF